MDTMGFHAVRETDGVVLLDAHGTLLGILDAAPETSPEDRFDPFQVGLDHLAFAVDDADSLNELQNGSWTPRAVAQRPFAAVFDAGCRWKTLPSWVMVGTRDLMIHPDAQRFMAQRAGARTIEEIDASHSVAVSQPKAVADLVEVAVNATAPVKLNA